MRARHGEVEPGDDNGGAVGDDDHDNSGPGSHGEDSSGPGSSHSGRGRAATTTTAPAPTAPARDLIVGATVEEAELELEHGVASFEEVELVD